MFKGNQFVKICRSSFVMGLFQVTLAHFVPCKIMIKYESSLIQLFEKTEHKIKIKKLK